MAKYDHAEIELKWQREWEARGLFAVNDDPAKKKCYILDMFPYPSGAGLHIGHPEGYTATDIVARKRRMEGWNVLHPMGWDAFGLPAENYAIKTGVHPAQSTAENADNFRRQLKMLGFSYDWSREIDTSSSDYYRWTQWLFLQLYKRGLAYKRKAPVNWCPSCHTVLANEQVADGKCERCGTSVEQRDLAQWFFRVTEYADRLLDGLEPLDWPEKIKVMQKNWIGRSEGAEIVFRGLAPAESDDSVSAVEFELPVFTTRPDTLFGVAAVVLAPEHPLVERIVAEDRRPAARAYVEVSRRKSELERTGLELEKTGEPLGVNVLHPLTGREIPVWIADYVLAGYGTGAVMAVPAHDERDWSFAKKYGLPVKFVIAPPHDVSEARHARALQPSSPPAAAYTDSGTMVNSGEFDGLMSDSAKKKIAGALESKGLGRRAITYRIRDWLISRQRYWGAPIPIILCETCGEVPVPEDQLPVRLPDDVDFRPTGESPLTRSVSFHDVKCPRCGQPARREPDTMDTFVDSSWYFLRYASPKDGAAPFDAHAVGYWCPVDLYVGGAEHATKHLLYARFVAKALFDQGLLSFEEPFLALRNQGLIMGEDGQKMSKSRGNVVNPDDVVREYGADALRLYLMFMGEFDEAKPWDRNGIVGARRFLDRLWTAIHEKTHGGWGETSPELARALHKTVKKVSADIEACKFNTAISAMMILMNEWQRLGGGDHVFAGTFVRLVGPFAPHLADELWQAIGNAGSVIEASWPPYDDALTVDEMVIVAVQVDGKVRDRIEVALGTDEETLKVSALASDKVIAALAGRPASRVVAVRDRLVNIVTSP